MDSSLESGLPNGVGCAGLHHVPEKAEVAVQQEPEVESPEPEAQAAVASAASELVVVPARY